MIGECRRCGHRFGAHRHYRRGTDCATVGCDCARFMVPWLWLVLAYGGWLLVPLIAAFTWHVARAWSLTSFVVAASTICVLWSLAGLAGRFVASEVAEQVSCGARIRDLPAYWWAIARHRPDNDVMTLLDEHNRLDPPESGG